MPAFYQAAIIASSPPPPHPHLLTPTSSPHSFMVKRWLQSQRFLPFLRSSGGREERLGARVLAAFLRAVFCLLHARARRNKTHPLHSRGHPLVRSRPSLQFLGATQGPAPRAWPRGALFPGTTFFFVGTQARACERRHARGPRDGESHTLAPCFSTRLPPSSFCFPSARPQHSIAHKSTHKKRSPTLVKKKNVTHPPPPPPPPPSPLLHHPASACASPA